MPTARVNGIELFYQEVGDPASDPLLLIMAWFSHEIHTRIAHARLVTIPDAGHLHFMEEFERFNSASLEFLQEHRAA